MNQGQPRTVITGLGAVTPLGTGIDLLWQGLSSGKSGVMKIQGLSTGGVGVSVAAEVRDFDAKNYVKQRKSLKVMARDIQLAVGAAHLAVENAKLDTSKVDPTRFGVSCGAAMIATDLDELGPPVSHSINGTKKFDLKKWGAEGMEQLFPLWMLKYLPNMPACHISIFYDSRGPNNTITTGEASSTLAIGEAFRILGRGDADVFITGGSDSKIHALSIVRLALLDRITKRSDDPHGASRPFDAQHSGLVPGEGAGLLVLESLEHANRRGAKVLAEIVGFGSSCNLRDRSVAVEKAAKRALRDASLNASDLGLIVAHGSSCPDEDRDEAAGLARLLGSSVASVPVLGLKGYYGHLSAANGAVDLVASVLAMSHGIAPATLNFATPDPLAPKLNVLTEAIDFPDKPFLLCDYSHRGQAAALVVRRPEA